MFSFLLGSKPETKVTKNVAIQTDSKITKDFSNDEDVTDYIEKLEEDNDKLSNENHKLINESYKHKRELHNAEGARLSWTTVDGMVWYGMVWYGMVWYGMVWYGMVWYGYKNKEIQIRLLESELATIYEAYHYKGNEVLTSNDLLRINNFKNIKEINQEIQRLKAEIKDLNYNLQLNNNRKNKEIQRLNGVVDKLSKLEEKGILPPASRRLRRLVKPEAFGGASRPTKVRSTLGQD
jgi:predicted RNase H-like nuclease (RuvC/YqgF family)